MYRAPGKCLYVVARNFFLLLLDCSAWPSVGPAYQKIHTFSGCPVQGPAFRKSQNKPYLWPHNERSFLRNCHVAEWPRRGSTSLNFYTIRSFTENILCCYSVGIVNLEIILLGFHVSLCPHLRRSSKTPRGGTAADKCMSR